MATLTSTWSNRILRHVTDTAEVQSFLLEVAVQAIGLGEVITSEVQQVDEVLL